MTSLNPASHPRGCEFYTKTPATIFSPEQFVGDEALMIETAAAFTRNEVMPHLERVDRQEEGLMPDLIRQAGELGLCGVDTPEAYGGLGLSKTIAARILEFMSLNGSFSVTYGITSGISQVGLSMFGTEDQKHRYLPRLASGEWIGAYALSEPDSGSDALSATTRADLVGGKYILNGTKMWISNAKWADLFLVMAKVDGDKFSAFLVERSYPGVSIAREEHKMGLKGSSTARLVLENAEVPVQNLLHEVGKGHHVAFNALNIGRFKLASMSIGPARDAISIAAGYALDRKQFSQPIASFGLIQRKFAMMAAWFYAAESMIYRTGAVIDGAFERTEGTIEGNRVAAEEFAVECSACKVFATEAEGLIVDEALQVYGGYGFTEEFPIARHYRDARVSKIYEGTNEINRLFIGERILRQIRDGRISDKPAGDSFLSELAGKAVAFAPTDQIGIGALADLIILTYAEQSTRLRAAESKSHGDHLYRAILPWLNSKGAEAYQLLTGEGVSLPEIQRADLAEIAAAVYQKRGPLT